MKYIVNYYYHSSVSVEVEADSKEEAIEKGYNLIDDSDILANTEEDDSPDAQEEEYVSPTPKEAEEALMDCFF